MKTCKKIFAGILVFVMMMSMCAFVSAEEAVAEPVEEVLLTLHDFEEYADGKTVSTGNIGMGVASPTAKNPSTLFLRGTSNKKPVTVREDSEGNKYLEVQHNRIGYNYYKSAEQLAGYSDNNCDAVSFSYDIMIPADDAYKTYRRYTTLSWGAKTTDAYTGIASSLNIYIEDGKIAASASFSSAHISNSYTYEYGDWVNIEAIGWIDEDSRLVSTVLVNGELIYYAISSGTVAGVCANQYNMEYYNNADGSGRVDSTTEGIVSITNYDNINISMYADSKKPSAADDVDFVNITSFDADSLATPDDASGWADVDGVRTADGGVGGIDILPAEGLTAAVFVQGSATKEATDYQIVTEADRKALKITSTNYVYNVGNNFRKITALTRSDAKQTFVLNYDMKIPSGSEDSLRRFFVTFGLDSAGSTETLKKYGIGLSGYYVDGEVYFLSTNGDEYGSAVENSKKSETRSVDSDVWFTMTCVAEVTRDEEGFNFDVYGIYDNEVIYYCQHKMAYQDRDKNDIDDEFSFVQSALFINKATSGNEVETYIDEISLVKNNSFDWSGINTDAWLVPAEITFVDDEGNVLVTASSSSREKFESCIMVVAIYNANGMLEEFIPVTTLTDIDSKINSFNYTVDAAKLATGKTVKAFVVDGITTFKPLIGHGEFEIE